MASHMTDATCIGVLRSLRAYSLRLSCQRTVAEVKPGCALLSLILLMVTINWKRALVYTKACLCEVCLISSDLVKNSNLRNSKKLRRASLVFQENIVLSSNILSNILYDSSI